MLGHKCIQMHGHLRCKTTQIWTSLKLKPYPAPLGEKSSPTDNTSTTRRRNNKQTELIRYHCSRAVFQNNNLQYPYAPCIVYLYIFIYIWAICGVNVGKYSIHGAYGINDMTTFNPVTIHDT
jgi:hypothetical protein